MQGYPKSLNTWDDVEYVVTNFDKSQWQHDLELLCSDNNVYMWVQTGTLAEGDTGVEDATHKVEERDDGEIGSIRAQLEKRPNLLCRLGQMKFCKTEEDLNKAVKAVKELLEDKQ